MLKNAHKWYNIIMKLMTKLFIIPLSLPWVVLSLSFLSYLYTSLGIFLLFALFVGVFFIIQALKQKSLVWIVSTAVSITILIVFFTDLFSELKAFYCAGYSFAVIPPAQQGLDTEVAMKVMEQCTSSLTIKEYFCNTDKYMYATSPKTIQNGGCEKFLSNFFMKGY